MLVLVNRYFSNEESEKHGANSFWFNRKIQFKILEFPRFDLHVLLNSIINHQKAELVTICTHVSAV